MDLFSVLSNLAVLISALLGVAVSLWPPSPNNRKKIALMVAFLVLGVLAIAFQYLKAKSDKRESDEIAERNLKAQEELLFWQRGDPRPDHAPYVTCSEGKNADGTSALRFYLHNPSFYPAYEVTLKMRDNNRSPTSGVHYILTKTIPYIPARSLAEEVVSVNLGPSETAKSFAIELWLRTGEFRQNIAARKVRYGWVYATQMRRFVGPDIYEVIFKKVDSDFPSEAISDIDWWVTP